VLAASPSNGANSVAGDAPISIRFSAPLSPTSPLPTLDPAVAGEWTLAGSTATFTPNGAYPPDSRVSVDLPSGHKGIVGVGGRFLHTSLTLSFTVKSGSFVRAEQLLAELGFLPVSWRRQQPIVRGPVAYEKAAFHAPPGNFRLLGEFPSELWTMFRQGTSSPVFESALASFERVERLPLTTSLSAASWSDLLRLGYRPAIHRLSPGFTYALVDKALPEKITIWQGGAPVLESLANTGISASPTADGTFSVYLRFENQVMSGTSPWGTHYSDPVSWVAYFHGSEAVHYIARYSYGYPQSFGCVELPWAAAERAWGFLQIGTLVTVTG
jgi:hypothetical protein